MVRPITGMRFGPIGFATMLLLVGGSARSGHREARMLVNEACQKWPRECTVYGACDYGRNHE
jgi:hypothetical protein